MKTVKLAEVAEIASGGGAPQGDHHFELAGTPFIRAGSLPKLVSGETESSQELLSPSTAKAHGLVEFPAGTVLFAKSGMSATKGHIYTLKAPAYVVNHLAAIVPSERLTSRFLQRLLEWHSPTQLIKDTAYPSIRLSDIAAFQIPLPPLPEQKRIAALLDAADALRAQRRRALARLDDLARSIFLHHFGDPVANPKGWPVVALGEIGTLDRGVSKHRPRNDPALLGGNHPLIQTGDVANSGGYIRTYTSTYSDLGLQQSKMWPAGTLCITIAANIGKTGIMKFDACFPDSVVGFIANEKSEVEYVHRWFGFVQKYLEDSAPEVAQKNINLAILRNYPIPLPPLALQQRFARELAAVEAQKARQRAQLAQLDALFASLQSRAFIGGL